MDLENYSVKTEVFEGPLDVLLSLIEKKKLLINDISLSKVADDFVAYVRAQESLPIADTAQFVLIASTLILIKSKSLLPDLELSIEEEQSVDELKNRLVLRARYKELAKHIADRFGRHMLFSALPRENEVIVFAPDKRLNSNFLLDTMRKVIASIPKVEELPKAIVKKVISLEEAIVDLTNRVSTQFKINFSGKHKINPAEKSDFIVSFLAMLELVKQGIVSVTQDSQFANIEMESAQVGVPRY